MLEIPLIQLCSVHAVHFSFESWIRGVTGQVRTVMPITLDLCVELAVRYKIWSLIYTYKTHLLTFNICNYYKKLISLWSKSEQDNFKILHYEEVRM